MASNFWSICYCPPLENRIQDCMSHWFDPTEQLLSFWVWSLCRKYLESTGHNLICLLTWFWLSSSESPEAGDRCRSVIQTLTSHHCCFTGIEGGFWRRENNLPFCLLQARADFQNRSSNYQRSVCLLPYLVFVSHSHKRLMQTLNFPIELISCNSWQEGPKESCQD